MLSLPLPKDSKMWNFNLTLVPNTNPELVVTACSLTPPSAVHRQLSS